jgi:hypothetical protein
LKRAAAAAGVTLALALGGAAAAQAATSYTYIAKVNGGPFCGVYQTVDYDWWEETFQGKRDYTRFLYYTACPTISRVY